MSREVTLDSENFTKLLLLKFSVNRLLLFVVKFFFMLKICKVVLLSDEAIIFYHLKFPNEDGSSQL